MTGLSEEQRAKLAEAALASLSDAERARIVGASMAKDETKKKEEATPASEEVGKTEAAPPSEEVGKKLAEFAEKCQDAEPKERLAMCIEAEALGTKAIPFLLDRAGKDSYTDNQEAALHVLARLGDESALDALREIVKDNGPGCGMDDYNDVGIMATICVSIIRKDVEPDLKKKLQASIPGLDCLDPKDLDGGARHGSADNLKQGLTGRVLAFGKAVEPVLAGLIEKPLDDENLWLYLRCGLILWVIRKEPVPELTKLLEMGDQHFKKLVLRTMGRTKDPAAIEYFKKVDTTGDNYQLEGEVGFWTEQCEKEG